MSSHNTLSGKVALVTGASRGIGASIARRLAREGASVAITYLGGKAQAEALVKEIEAAGGKAKAIQADSGDAAAVKAAVAEAASHFGRIDILVNNAGILRTGTIDQVTLEDLDRSLAVNVRGLFVATQEAVRHMGKGGRVINVGSVNSDYMPFPGGSVYAMTKGAVASLTRGLARDLAPQGITVNNIQPGPTDTDMNPANGPSGDFLRSLTAVKRYGTGEEIASMVSYLASPDASFVTGASLMIDGGFSA